MLILQKYCFIVCIPPVVSLGENLHATVSYKPDLRFQYAGMSNKLSTCFWVGLCCVCQVLIDVKQSLETHLSFCQQEIYRALCFCLTETEK